MYANNVDMGLIFNDGRDEGNVDGALSSCPVKWMFSLSGFKRMPSLHKILALWCQSVVVYSS